MDMPANACIPLLAALVLAVAGCATQHRVEVAPVEVKPIHITIDVNIKVDRALDDFFGDLDQKAATMEGGAVSSTP
jgi:Skp family chaperone for outer membrane proteins